MNCASSSRTDKIPILPVMPDVHSDGAPLGIVMVKKNKLHLFYVIKDVGGRMARDGRIFKSR